MYALYSAIEKTESGHNSVADDPWMAAHKFLESNELSPMFLDQVATFIMKNTEGVTLGQAPSQVSDPFTGKICISTLVHTRFLPIHLPSLPSNSLCILGANFYNAFLMIGLVGVHYVLRVLVKVPDLLPCCRVRHSV